MSSWAPAEDTTYPGDTVAYTGTAGTTNEAWAKGPSKVLVTATTAAYVKVVNASDGVATASSQMIPANTPIILAVPPSYQAFWVSALQVAAGGDVYAKPGELVP